MEEKNRSMTDEALSQQLRRHKSGKLTGRLLSSPWWEWSSLWQAWSWAATSCRSFWVA